MAGLLSKNVKLGYKTSSAASAYTNVANVREFPDLGAAPEQVDVTCLSDGNMKYINGLVDFGSLEFTLLYDNSDAASNFRVLKALENTDVYWQIEFPDALTTGTGDHHGTQFQFVGQPSVRINGAGVNAALEFTLSISVNSDFTVVNPE